MGFLGSALYLDLVGGPLCGGRVPDSGLLCYVLGVVARSVTGQRVWQVSYARGAVIPNREPQFLYRRMVKGNRHWYAYEHELDLDSA